MSVRTIALLAISTRVLRCMDIRSEKKDFSVLATLPMGDVLSAVLKFRSHCCACALSIHLSCPRGTRQLFPFARHVQVGHAVCSAGDLFEISEPQLDFSESGTRELTTK